MPTIDSPLYKAQQGKVSGLPASTMVQGKLRAAIITIPNGTVLTNGDKVNLVELPPGAKVIPSLSVTEKGNASAKMSIGDAGSAARYATDVTGTARAPLSSFGGKIAVDGGQEVVQGTVTATGTLATDWTLIIIYSVV